MPASHPPTQIITNIFFQRNMRQLLNARKTTLYQWLVDFILIVFILALLCCSSYLRGKKTLHIHFTTKNTSQRTSIIWGCDVSPAEAGENWSVNRRGTAAHRPINTLEPWHKGDARQLSSYSHEQFLTCLLAARTEEAAWIWRELDGHDPLRPWIAESMASWYIGEVEG